jgi:Arc/MetJ family transcription regulator
MTRTHIDLDDDACGVVMQRYDLTTKHDAVNVAQRTAAAEPLGPDAARLLRESGRNGDLDENRAGRAR